MQIAERGQLLAEENQLLLEQINNLRAHYDTFNEEYTVQVNTAEAKVRHFDTILVENKQLSLKLLELTNN